MKIKPITFLFLLFCMGCNPNPSPPFLFSDTADCHRNLGNDSSRVAQALIGEWEWQFVSCFSSPQGNEDASSGLTIDIRNDGTLIVRNPGGGEAFSTWELEPVGGMQSLQVEPSIPELDGRIWICDDELVLNGSFRDICDNFFRRE